MLSNDITRSQIQSFSFKRQANDQPLPQQFTRLLGAVGTVSFDLFDTLVHRKNLFSPKDLFYQVQTKAEKQLRLKLENYPAIRIRAEEIARVRAWGRGMEEVTLDEIYLELGRIMKIDSEKIQGLKNIELDCERAALIAMESGRRFFQAALAAGKQIVIISDTYFDEDFVTKVVKQCGYCTTKRIFTSSKYRKTKQHGSLYDVVLKELQCTPAKLLHVGDNQLSDVTMALNRGLRAYYLPTPKHRLKWRHGFSDTLSGDQVLSAMLCTVSQKSSEKAEFNDLQSVLEQTATENLAPLYYAFSTWLLAQLRKGGYQRVYFAARDGLIMKRFFDLVADASGFEIDSRYLYISRAALYPSLVFTDPETAKRLFCHYWDRLTVEDALQRISLTFDESADLLAKYELGNRKMKLDHSTAPGFADFVSEVWPLLEDRNSEHYQLIIEYLSQEMLLSTEKTALVDIGWHGSLQNCLLKLLNHLGIKKELNGYYLGTFEKPTCADPNFKSKGFLVDNSEPAWITELVRSGPSVLELFHSAGHGSVLGYERNDRGIVPILEENYAEQGQFKATIEPIQNLAFEFVSKHLRHGSKNTRGLPDPGIIARIALRAIYAPTVAEATAFGRLRIASDFGGRMKSITGAMEWDLKKIGGDTLPDGTSPIWRPGFHILKGL